MPTGDVYDMGKYPPKKVEPKHTPAGSGKVFRGGNVLSLCLMVDNQIGDFWAAVRDEDANREFPIMMDPCPGGTGGGLGISNRS